MAKHRIAWLPGDGVGIEVLEAAKVLPLAKSRQAIIDAGGLIPYTRSRLLQTA